MSTGIPVLSRILYEKQDPNLLHHQLQQFVGVYFFAITLNIVAFFSLSESSQVLKDMGMVPDRGGFVLAFFDDQKALGCVMRDTERDRTDYRDPDLPRDDDMTDPYFYFDDGYLRGLNNVLENHAITTSSNNNTTSTNNTNINNIPNRKRQCQRIAEHRMNIQKL